jgi:hypothetical protein
MERPTSFPSDIYNNKLFPRFESAARRDFLCSIAWIFGLLALFLILNLAPGLRPDEETVGSWFERSGALVVVFGLVAEFRVRRIESTLEMAALRLEPEYFKKLAPFERRVVFLHRAVLIYAAFGALIWSYGEPLLTGLSKL